MTSAVSGHLTLILSLLKFSMREFTGLLTLSSFGWLLVFLIVLVITLGIGITAFWVWVLVEILTRETDENNIRLLWTLVILFTGWLGAFIYLLTRRGERIRKLGR
ncbi:MAG: PLDc N-terminal domain-containing protein [bacterium]